MNQYGTRIVHANLVLHVVTIKDMLCKQMEDYVVGVDMILQSDGNLL